MSTSKLFNFYSPKHTQKKKFSIISIPYNAYI